jgi:hypothetical protein
MNTQLKNSSSAVGLSGNNSKKKNKWWLYLLFLLIAIAIVLYFVLKKDKNETTPILPTVAPVEVVDTTSVEKATEENTTKSTEAARATNSNSLSSAASTDNSQSAKDYDDIARATVQGYYGNGQSRKDALANKYSEVQRRVNEGKGVWWNPIY